MIYYRYDLRWKNYKSTKDLDAHERSKFEMKYSRTFLSALNEELYAKFRKKDNYIISITDRVDSILEVYVAVDIKHIADDYENKICKLIDDCEIVLKKEITVEEYRREISSDNYVYSSRDLLERLNIYYRVGMFDRLPFDLKEQIFTLPSTDLNGCYNRAKEILGSKSLLEEIDRIYSKENKKEYYGHPVHYMVSAGDWNAAKDIYELLLKALHSNKRLLSNRVAILRNIVKGAYKDERFKQIISAASGGTIIIELTSEDGSGRFATDFHELTKTIGLIMEQEKRDALFIFVEISGQSINDIDALNNILTKADVIQITEGTGTYEQAKNYLFELIEKGEFAIDEKEDVMQFLTESETYSVTDIFNAYNAWYGSGLKNHIYKAYKDKKSFQVTVLKVESKPYEELQNMIGLTDIKQLADQIIASSKILRMRERMGLNTDSSSLHMMFSGNPGTAKTTVARLLAKILKDEDAISSGRFVECGRQDLVGKYVGWTAPTVEQKFKEAMGGILFIDEAYALVDESNTFGAEAINAITQMMENYRNDVIVIFAGYPDKMQEFIAQNEGLKSRIAFHLDFPDYTAAELFEIMKLMASKKEYSVSPEAYEICHQIFEQATKEKDFGNGRFARNVLEQAILKQSNRIVSEYANCEITKEELCCLNKEDFRIPEIKQEKQHRIIGFSA